MPMADALKVFFLVLSSSFPICRSAKVEARYFWLASPRALRA